MRKWLFLLFYLSSLSASAQTDAAGMLRIRMVEKRLSFSLSTLMGKVINKDDTARKASENWKIFDPLFKVLKESPSEVIFLPGSDPRLVVNPGEPPRTAVTSRKLGDPIYFNQDIVNRPGQEPSWSEIFRIFIHEYGHKIPEIPTDKIELLASKVALLADQSSGQKTVQLRSGKTIKLDWIQIPQIYFVTTYQEKNDDLNFVALTVGQKAQDITEMLREKSRMYGSYRPVTPQQIEQLSFDEESRKINRGAISSHPDGFGLFHHVLLNISGAELTEETSNMARLRVRFDTNLKVSSPYPSATTGPLPIITPYHESTITQMQMDLDIATANDRKELIQQTRLKPFEKFVRSALDISLTLDQNESTRLTGSIAYLEEMSSVGQIKLHLRIDGQSLTIPVQRFSIKDKKRIEFEAPLLSQNLGFTELKLEAVEIGPAGNFSSLRYVPQQNITLNNSRPQKASPLAIRNFEIIEKPSYSAIASEKALYPRWKMKGRVLVHSETPVQTIRLEWHAFNIIEPQPNNRGPIEVIGYLSTSSRKESITIDASQLKQTRRGDFMEVEFPFELFSQKFPERETTTNPFPPGHVMYAQKRDYGLDSRIYHIDRIQVVNQSYQVINAVPNMDVQIRTPKLCLSLFF